MNPAASVCLLVLVSVALTTASVVAPAATLVRAPSYDSAVVRSERVGGSFAYSTAEGHAYAAISPVVTRVVEPVAVTYTASQVPLGYQYYPTFVGGGYYPVFGGLGGGVGGFGPVAAAPPPQQAAAAPQPVPGTPVDDDTVAVEAA